VPILVKIDQEMRRESARRRTHTPTDANWFDNLSFAICYIYGADKNDGETYIWQKTNRIM